MDFIRQLLRARPFFGKQPHTPPLLPENESHKPIPQSYWVGQQLDWEAPSIPVTLYVELPFWLMLSDCAQKVVCREHTFRVFVKSAFYESFVREFLDSRNSLLHIGADPSTISPEARKLIEKQKLPVMPRKCKTVLQIHTHCNGDVIVA